MKNRLRYISISHKSASLTHRERFHFSHGEKEALINSIHHYFSDIKGLLVLVTCNRSEVYFESDNTLAAEMRDFVTKETLGRSEEHLKSHFQISDITADTVNHILKVSSGLASSVLGDAEIIHQIRKAYHHSCDLQLQGSLLERCMQLIFRTHKRISNETGFRDGTTSVAYKSLKIIANNFDTEDPGPRKILLVGAGDIVKQLLNYNNKFGYGGIHIANRTAEKATELTQKYGGSTYPWERVVNNDFNNFDVIIAAVSNCPNLVHSIGERKDKILLLDLAVPGNIDEKLAFQPQVVHYNLDSIAKVLEHNRTERMKSIENVRSIIQEELCEYLSWLEKAPKRTQMASYKTEVDRWLTKYLNTNDIELSSGTRKMVTDRIVRKSIKKKGMKIMASEMQAILTEHL